MRVGACTAPPTSHARTIALARVPIERGLEAADVEDEPRVANQPYVARPWLEIVRLCARRGQVDDVEPGASDLLGRPGQRVEPGDDVGLAVALGTARCREHERSRDENRSRLHPAASVAQVRIVII